MTRRSAASLRGRSQFVFQIILALALPVVCQSKLQRSDAGESLRGLRGLHVVSQLVDAQPEGLTTNVVEALARTRLLSAGILVEAEPDQTNGNASLSITISTMKDAQRGLCVFTVEAAVTQDVQLTRQAQSGPVSAKTWTKTVQGITTPDHVDAIEEAVKQCVDDFVTSYQAANPRTKLAPPQMLRVVPAH
jgi:hypothetical protein